mgnify:CR=1 FL=1
MSAFMKLTAEAKARIKEVTPEQLREMQARLKHLYLIDVREDGEWVHGSIPDAVHISKGLLECKIESVIPDPAAEIVLFCGGGYRSALAADNLQKMGYQNVYSLIGGYAGWSEN